MPRGAPRNKSGLRPSQLRRDQRRYPRDPGRPAIARNRPSADSIRWEIAGLPNEAVEKPTLAWTSTCPPPPRAPCSIFVALVPEPSAGATPVRPGGTPSLTVHSGDPLDVVNDGEELPLGVDLELSTH